MLRRIRRGAAAGPSWQPLLVIGLAVADLALERRTLLLPLAALALLAVSWRASSRAVAVLAAGALLVAGAARPHLLLLERDWASRARRDLLSRREAVEHRKEALVARAESSAERVAALPETRLALAGDREALIRLFRSLESQRGAARDAPAVAVHTLPFSILAWSGRVPDLRAFQGIVGARKGVFVLEGSVSATFVATVPIHGSSGQVEGLATAVLPVAAQRNIRNDFLSDFDLLAGADPGAEIRYVDSRDERERPEPFPPPAPGALSQEALLRAADGRVLAAVRLTSPGVDEAGREVDAAYRAALSVLAGLAFLVWGFSPAATRRSRALRLILVSAALRGTLLVLGPALPGFSSPLLSPDTYASTLLGPLLRSPADLFLTAVWFAFLGGLLLQRALEATARRSPGWWLGAALLTLTIVAATFTWISDTVANCSLDIATVSLLPRSGVHLLLHASLVLVLGAGLLLLTAFFCLAAPPAASLPGRLRLLAGVWLGGLLAYRFWPSGLVSLPLLPALALLGVPALLGVTRDRWLPWLKTVAPGARAGLALCGVLILSLILFPSLVHYSEEGTRLQIERDHAPLVLRQPGWREYVLAAARRQINTWKVLEDEPPSLHPPRIEELAFAVWSATDLAAFGLSSAVEIQDAAGGIISRFALNLPSLSGPGTLPSRSDWEVTRERKTVASAERPVLHARKLLVYHGEVHGAIHVYVGEDFWNLPFLTGRDPYSVLYRSAPRRVVRDRPLALLAYDAGLDLAFSSAEAPPVLPPRLASRVRGSPDGLWTILSVDGRQHHVFLFTEGAATYGLGFPRREPLRYVTDMVEASTSLTLLAVAVLFILVLVRTIAGRPSLSVPSILGSVEKRFALRLFVAFTLLAFVPLAVLQIIVRGFVAERLKREFESQALERAVFAKKVVEDFVFFQRGEPAASRPVTDEALVWLADRIRNDLDVFARGPGSSERGRLLASSKRELYDSGLLPPRVSGAVFRALSLEAAPHALRNERIGGFSYLVVSVPLRVGDPEPGILSIPLALRQREVDTVLDDLDRTILLASIVFLALAAALAHSMARRISGPISDLTRATARVAGGDLGTRVETTSRDELQGLVESFNRMAGDLERQRRDLERSNRLAAWAEMARQVAHEVKNPLTPIQLSAEHLRRVYADRSADFAATLESCTQTILKQVRILRGIVTEFSAFARPPAPVLELHDLAGLLTDIVRPYQGALPPGVELSLDLQEGVPPVRADRRLLERAVLNLLENALQAVGEKGVIRVGLKAAEAGRRVEVEVQDSGGGMEPAVRDRVFQPFFSTKTSGSGLGLALVKKIAEDHGGGVVLESAAGRGTRAVLWLPAATAAELAPAPEGGAALSEERVPARRETRS